MARFFIFRKEGPLSEMGEAQIKILLNGKERQIALGTTVSALLRDLSLPATRVAVEHNAEIIRKPSFDTIELASGDRLEIVTLVGGG
jgi:thiamine biosynthesis protein ThiS